MYYAFEGCNGLESLSFPHFLEKISDNAFDSCSKVGRVSFKGPTSIGKHAFRNCGGLKVLELSEETNQLGIVHSKIVTILVISCSGGVTLSRSPSSIAKISMLEIPVGYGIMSRIMPQSRIFSA